MDTLDALGAIVEFLTAPGADDGASCIIRGTARPGAFVPLHSHADPETCVLTTAGMGRFFREIGSSIVPGRQSSVPLQVASIQHYLQVAERYGHWTATAEQNAEFGLPMPGVV